MFKNMSWYWWSLPLWRSRSNVPFSLSVCREPLSCNCSLFWHTLSSPPKMGHLSLLLHKLPDGSNQSITLVNFTEATAVPGHGGLRARWTERSAHKRRLTDLHDLQSKIKYANFAFLSMSACSLYLRECISFGISTFSSCTLETTSFIKINRSIFLLGIVLAYTFP